MISLNLSFESGPVFAGSRQDPKMQPAERRRTRLEGPRQPRGARIVCVSSRGREAVSSAPCRSSNRLGTGGLDRSAKKNGCSPLGPMKQSIWTHAADTPLQRKVN